MTEISELFERLRGTSISMYEMEEKVRDGELASPGIWEDEELFEKNNPGNPLAVSLKDVRMFAADELYELLVIKNQTITEVQHKMLLDALFDCCAAVRHTVARIFGHLRDEKSLPALIKLAADEKDSEMVKGTAAEAVKIIKGELKPQDSDYFWGR